MFDEEYLDSLPSDPLLALSQVIDKTIQGLDKKTMSDVVKNYETFLEAFAIIQALANQVDGLSLDAPSIKGTPKQTVDTIIAFCDSAKIELSKHDVQLKAAQFSNKYQARFGNIFAYEFSEGDLKRIQVLINELRDAIAASDLFEEGHKQRLLARLEKIQSELHKKMADLDRLWGLVGEAGIVLGKFGENAKPFVARIREIIDIVRGTQSRAEGLPSNTPMNLLGKDDATGPKSQ
ncbi:MAG: hypothetical protein BECKG1743D_GA0114223_101203 [Candidatus Kentron sp. G]|nr:MAG: hypothetical protein BECKG1743E_GA0114224_102462 [Candidatus Kentron sp. G]VFM99399.1 MAG: hypothetical protein BECKG1743D_GA0114223_101203 [Candidatus Kentron sp. G]